MKEFWKLLSADVCNEITNSVFFNKEYEGIYHKSFLVIRQNWIQTMIHLAPSSMSITLYKRMKACQSVSQMAIQEDTKEILERSRNGVTSPIPLNEHYSNLLLFEQNAEKSIEELIELAVKDGLKIQEILLALHLLEKAYQMNTTDCVTNYLKKRITLYVQEETESLQTVSEWLMEWISDLFLHEKPLLKECLQTMQSSLQSLYPSCESDSTRLSLQSLCQAILFITTTQSVEDRSLTLTLTTIISTCITNGQISLTFSSLESLANSLIELLTETNSQSYLPLIHTVEILLERLVIPSSYTSLLPSITLCDMLPLFTQSQAILAYAYRHSFFDALALSRTHALTSHSSHQFLSFIVRSSCQELQSQLCHSAIATLLRIDHPVEAFFFILSPLFVLFHSFTYSLVSITYSGSFSDGYDPQLITMEKSPINCFWLSGYN